MPQQAARAVVHEFVQAADTITLDETARHRRRMAMRSDHGIEFLLDLPEARLLNHGDGLMLDDGRIIEVRAEPEALYEVRGRDPRHLLALAWQLGNRHLPAQIHADHILVREDHVIHDMLLGLGATVQQVNGPFSPEGGAYAGHAHSGHHHEHGGHHHDHD
ncbi:urease accessory protein UreE [Nitratireductor luteus]|uniref:urease accessory protein UreE n=1 Tax=Nitratireductor luteus TaxID=2976980 RepID=UPI002240490C|nr:urease accessory protein UreE [Nitratireductor luteus]